VSGAQFKQATPKGIHLSVFNQADFDGIAHSQANRPRTTYAFHFPFEVVAEIVARACDPHRSKH
jgi:IS30 family transposase